MPRAAAVGRERHFGDALPAIERNAAHDRFAIHRNARVVWRLVMNERTVNRPIGFVAEGVVPGSTHAHGYRECGKRWPSRNPGTPVEHLDLGHVLDPVGPEIAGHHQPQRIAVEERQLRAVHLPRQHDLAVAGVIDVQRLDEVGAIAEWRLIEAVERHLHGAALHAGLVEDGFERHAGPARVAHRAVRELPAVDTWREVAAAVA